MKGLLLKDWYIFLKYGKMSLLVSILFAFVSVVSDSMIFLIWPVFFLAMTSVTTIAVEERCKWDRFADALPVSRAQVVFGKYLFAFAGTLLIALFRTAAALAAQALHISVAIAPFAALWLMPSAGLIFLSLIYPFIFKFGAEKGRTVYLGVMLLLCAGIVLCLYLDIDLITLTSQLSALPAFAAPFGAMMLALLSLWFSVRFYQMRES
jgi:ABC-2 type transport system permease protein